MTNRPFWLKYHQAQKARAQESVYEALKRFDKEPHISLSGCVYEALVSIKQTNLCLRTSDLAAIQTGLKGCQVKYEAGEYAENIVGRGILPLDLSGFLEDFDQVMNRVLQQMADQYRMADDTPTP